MTFNRFAPAATLSATLLAVTLLAAPLAAAWLLDGRSPGVGAAAAAGVGGERASFSALINGASIKADRVAAPGINRASITPDGNEFREMIFSLAPTSGDEHATPELSLRFDLPVKLGTYELMSNDIAACDDCGVTLDQNSTPYAQYSPQKMQVSSTSLTANRVTGTFSGTLEFSSQTPESVRQGSPPIIRVENGQFDIPIARL